MDHKLIEKKSLGTYISLFYRTGTSYLTQEFSKYNIGYGQIQFLVILYIKDGVSHDELTKIIHVDKATTTRAITKLYNNGYVTMQRDEKDKRLYRIFLTDKALAIREEVMEIAGSWEDKLLNCLSDEEQTSLFNMVQKIAVSNKWMPD